MVTFVSTPTTICTRDSRKTRKWSICLTTIYSHQPIRILTINKPTKCYSRTGLMPDGGLERVYSIKSYFLRMVTHRVRWRPSPDDSAIGWIKENQLAKKMIAAVDWIVYIGQVLFGSVLYQQTLSRDYSEGGTWTRTNQAIHKIRFESIPCQCQTVAKPIRDCLTTLPKFKVRCWKKK